MQLLLCAATELEIRPVMDLLKGAKQDAIDVLITGVGLTAATYSITRQVFKKRPDFILQAGIAGCLDDVLPLTRVVMVENETIGDLGVEEKGKFHSLFDLKLLKRDHFPWTDGKLKNDLGKLIQAGVPVVDGVTVNEISTSRDRIEVYKKEYGASVETMEGAALHYVGLQEGIRFLQIRSLSNFAGERDKSQWMMEMAIGNLGIELERILTKFIL